MAEPPLSRQELARMGSHPNFDDHARLIEEVRRLQKLYDSLAGQGEQEVADQVNTLKWRVRESNVSASTLMLLNDFIADWRRLKEQLEENPTNVIYCHGCSEAGGAERGIYHQPPVCSTNKVVAERNSLRRTAEELAGALKMFPGLVDIQALHPYTVDEHMRRIEHWVVQFRDTALAHAAQEGVKT